MAIRQTGVFQTSTQDSMVEEIQAKAEGGDGKAQYDLGLMYYGGYFATQDYLKAFKWFSLALANGENRASPYRDALGALLNPEQMAEAKKQIAEFALKSPVKKIR